MFLFSNPAIELCLFTFLDVFDLSLTNRPQPENGSVLKVLLLWLSVSSVI